MKRYVFSKWTDDLRPPLPVAVAIGVGCRALLVACGAAPRTTDGAQAAENRRRDASIVFRDESLFLRRFAVTASPVATSFPRSPTRARPARPVKRSRQCIAPPA